MLGQYSLASRGSLVSQEPAVKCPLSSRTIVRSKARGLQAVRRPPAFEHLMNCHDPIFASQLMGSRKRSSGRVPAGAVPGDSDARGNVSCTGGAPPILPYRTSVECVAPGALLQGRPCAGHDARPGIPQSRRAEFPKALEMESRVVSGARGPPPDRPPREFVPRAAGTAARPAATRVCPAGRRHRRVRALCVHGCPVVTMPNYGWIGAVAAGVRTEEPAHLVKAQRASRCVLNCMTSGVSPGKLAGPGLKSWMRAGERCTFVPSCYYSHNIPLRSRAGPLRCSASHTVDFRPSLRRRGKRPARPERARAPSISGRGPSIGICRPPAHARALSPRPLPRRGRRARGAPAPALVLAETPVRPRPARGPR
jgi:hypothetical protein